MKLFLLIAASACIVLFVLGCLSSTLVQLRADAFDELAKANDELDRAISRNDADALGRIYADDYVFIPYNGGLADKQKQVWSVASGVMRFMSYAVQDRTTRLYGNLAVTVLRRKQIATVRGQKRPDHVRSTRVWVKRNGTWQLVSAQVTPVSPIAAPNLVPARQPSASSSRGQIPVAAGSAEERVLEAEEDLREAVLRGDIIVLDKLMADDYTVVTLDGSLSAKIGELAIYSATRRVQPWSTDQVRCRIYNNAAVVTGRATTVDTLPGKNRSLQFRFTHVWVNKDGRWQVVSRHATRIL